MAGAQTRIRWSDRELDAIRAELHRRVSENALVDNAGAVMTAQQAVLPLDRRRPANSAVVARFIDTIRAAREVWAAQQKVAAIAAVEAAPERSEPAAATNIATSGSERQGDPTAGLGALFEALVDAIADRVAERLRAVDAAPIVREPALRHNPFGILKPRAHPKRVVVVGLLGAQAHKLGVHPVGPGIEVVHVCSARAEKGEPVQGKYTVLMTKFISHNIQTRYRDAPGLHFCNGGVGELTTLLRAIAIRESGEAVDTGVSPMV